MTNLLTKVKELLLLEADEAFEAGRASGRAENPPWPTATELYRAIYDVIERPFYINASHIAVALDKLRAARASAALGRRLSDRERGMP